MTPRALIVDLFGTLVPKWSSRHSVETKRRMAECLGVEDGTFREAWDARWWDRELGRVSTDACLFEIALDLAPDVAQSSIDQAHETWCRFVALQLQPRPDALETLAAARAKGLRIGLVSNAGPIVPGLFHASPMADAVDFSVFSCTVGAAKPDAAIYAAVCQALAVTPAECVYMGDGGDDELAGAQRIGMAPVLLRVDAEIEREGAASSVEAWAGPSVATFRDILPLLAHPVPSRVVAADEG